MPMSISSAIYGYEHPDWLLGSMDPTKTKCEDIKGQPVGVDRTAARVRSRSTRCCGNAD